jgi:pyrroloquinoline quinone biosynthesis protein E
MKISEKYPALMKNRALRISKGRNICKNLRTGDCDLLDEQSFVFLRMCNGRYRLQDIISVHTQVFGQKMFSVEVFLEKYKHILNFCDQPAFVPQLENMDVMLSAREIDWPFHPFREETPFSLEVSLTEVCNHRCTYCFQGKEHKHNPGLSLEEWKSVIYQAAGLGVQEIVFTGGEPTLYPDFIELVKTAADNGLYPKISTNGSTLDRPFVEALKGAGAEYIHLSLPAVSPLLYHQITKTKESLEKVKRAIFLLKEKNFYIRAKMVLIPQNTEECSTLLDFCGENHIDMVHLAPFIASTKTGDDYALVPSEEALSQVLKRAEAAEKKYPGMLIAKPATGLWEWKNEKEIVRCGGIKENLTVISNGNITFCEPLGQIQEFILGNVRTHTLAEIWNSEAPDRYTKVSVKDEPCISCEYLESCNTGCFLFSYIAEKDAYSADPRCFRYNGRRICSNPPKDSN